MARLLRPNARVAAPLWLHARAQSLLDVVGALGGWRKLRERGSALTRKNIVIGDVQRTRCSNDRARRACGSPARGKSHRSQAHRASFAPRAPSHPRNSAVFYAGGLWRCFASRPHAPITRKTRSIATADGRGSSMVRPSASSRISTTSASSRVMTVPANSSARTPSGSPSRPKRCTVRANGGAANLPPVGSELAIVLSHWTGAFCLPWRV